LSKVNGSSIQIEPYAGVTYLSYNRICSTVQPLSDGMAAVGDPYYHTAKYKEIKMFCSNKIVVLL
jgi:hypothetical protein